MRAGQPVKIPDGRVGRVRTGLGRRPTKGNHHMVILARGQVHGTSLVGPFHVTEMEALDSMPEMVEVLKRFPGGWPFVRDPEVIAAEDEAYRDGKGPEPPEMRAIDAMSMKLLWHPEENPERMREVAAAELRRVERGRAAADESRRLEQNREGAQ